LRQAFSFAADEGLRKKLEPCFVYQKDCCLVLLHCKENASAGRGCVPQSGTISGGGGGRRRKPAPQFFLPFF